MPVWVMKQMLPPSEFRGWLKYIANKQPDVNEMQMAVLTAMVAQGLGSKNASYKDFLIRKQETRGQKNNIMSAGEVKSIFSGLAS